MGCLASLSTHRCIRWEQLPVISWPLQIRDVRVQCTPHNPSKKACWIWASSGHDVEKEVTSGSEWRESELRQRGVKACLPSPTLAGEMRSGRGQNSGSYPLPALLILEQGSVGTLD